MVKTKEQTQKTVGKQTRIEHFSTRRSYSIEQRLQFYQMVIYIPSKCTLLTVTVKTGA